MCFAKLEAFGFLSVSAITIIPSGDSTRGAMVEDCENTNERQLSEKSTNGTNSNGAQQSEKEVDILVDKDDAEGNSSREDDHDNSVTNLRGHFSFNPPPSYMRSKSGVDMDPYRVRIRVDISRFIAQLPCTRQCPDKSPT